ncbi:hypothetical protein HGO97_006490 [Faecalicatena sp. AGMB00832]|uniref:ATP-grasp domain-containing protein n=1 Tax=Faecalicatena faecalis TaxID=2726362 RepID=A0ABS6D1S8_9FIRM|nr:MULTISPECIES: hypothetical protein [Faecalicatena]MBU3875459.1 hypothetical protein [Faecalicatena faecalis]MCI6466099.1 hypothetical protein [Faecalicatena sp.]MDY4670427.1 hypothetical protein [Oliverpabstia sp.]MDY5621129.1 hypothetical protein [Lachnospiraceae bacterium]
MKYWVICDYRENLKNYSESDEKLYNDHPARKNILEIIRGINSLGYECDYFGGIPELVHAVDNHTTFENCMFLNFTDGMDQSYSRVQAPVLLDLLKVPYSGSDVFPSVIMNNKYFCKQALLNNGIVTAKSCIANSYIPLDFKDLSSWKFPLFVKPNCEGSSLGISSKSVCHTMAETKNRVEELQNEFGEVIIEEFIYGVDITNYLIGNPGNYYINDVITAELFDQSPYTIYDSKMKHDKLRTLYLNEEKIPIKTLKNIQQQSIEIAQILGARDICRIDYRLNLDTQEFSFIEINSAPRFSSTSEAGFIAYKRNIKFNDMLLYYIKAFNDRISLI